MRVGSRLRFWNGSRLSRGVPAADNPLAYAATRWRNIDRAGQLSTASNRVDGSGTVCLEGATVMIPLTSWSIGMSCPIASESVVVGNGVTTTVTGPAGVPDATL